MDRRGNLLLDAVVMFAMFVTATAFAAALMVHANIGALPAVISGLAILMLMITSHILLTRFAQGGDAERMDDFEAALEIIDGDLQRIDRMEDDVARLDLLTDKIEQFDRTLSSFEAANLSRLSSDMETMQTRLETLRGELETEARSQREELNTELRLLERLMKQLSIDLAATEDEEGEARAAVTASEAEDVAASAQDFEPIDFLETEPAAEETAEPSEAEEDAEPIDMTAESEPQRHEAGAWQGDWHDTEQLAERDEEDWETAGPSEDVAVESASSEDTAAEDEPVQETMAEDAYPAPLADEPLPADDTDETSEEEGAKLAASTAETEAEEAVGFAGDEDVWPASETEESPEEPQPVTEPEVTSETPQAAVSEEPAPEEPVLEEPAAQEPTFAEPASEEVAPEESDLVEADLGRVEAAEIEAAEEGVGTPAEETSETAPESEEHEELVLTDLVAEDLAPDEEPAEADSEAPADSTDEDGPASGETEETEDTERRDT
ncbi:hypothetical protein [Methyloligella solikamskensis]|uniref:Uncharacterized protein n=1 Tax=Methyloligella solikamskensis TaxID=1177756 RepID=A0ABW3JE22_9HYPH